MDIISNGTTVIADVKGRDFRLFQGKIDILMTKGVIFGHEALSDGRFMLYPTDEFEATEVRTELEMLNTAFGY